MKKILEIAVAGVTLFSVFNSVDASKNSKEYQKVQISENDQGERVTQINFSNALKAYRKNKEKFQLAKMLMWSYLLIRKGQHPLFQAKRHKIIQERDELLQYLEGNPLPLSPYSAVGNVEPNGDVWSRCELLYNELHHTESMSKTPTPVYIDELLTKERFMNSELSNFLSQTHVSPTELLKEVLTHK